jgi:hypothetical protein
VKKVVANNGQEKNYPSSFAVTKFFGSSKPYHKNDPTQHAFLERFNVANS